VDLTRRGGCSRNLCYDCPRPGEGIASNLVDPICKVVQVRKIRNAERGNVGRDYDIAGAGDDKQSGRGNERWDLKGPSVGISTLRIPDAVTRNSFLGRYQGIKASMKTGMNAVLITAIPPRLIKETKDFCAPKAASRPWRVIGWHFIFFHNICV